MKDGGKQMKITSITVGGFRNVEKTTLVLGGIVGIVSVNNFGKSNLLSAIDFAFDYISASPKIRRQMMESTRCIPLVPTLQNEPFYFEIAFDDPSLHGYEHVRYSFSFDWYKDDGNGSVIIDERISCKSKDSRTYANYLKRKSGKYRTSHETRSFRQLFLDKDQLAIDVLTAVEDTDIQLVVRKIKSLKYNISSSIDASDKFNFRLLDFKDFPFDTVELPKELYDLKLKHPDLYSAFEEAVYSLFPEFEEIAVKAFKVDSEELGNLPALGKEKDLPFTIREEFYRLMVKSTHLNQAVNIQRMSAGTQRVVWLIANTIIAAKEQGHQVLAIEEVETSIHPRLIEELLNQLNDNLSEASLLITTHSPYLVQYLKPEKIYVGIPADNGVARFRRLNKKKFKFLVKRAASEGLGFGEYIYSLMSGGPIAMQILNTYLEELD